MNEAATELRTLRDWLRHAVSRFNAAGLAFGHGFDNAYDEAAYLLLHALHLPLDRLEPFLDARLLPEERAELAQLLERRIAQRIPSAYLTGEAWLAGCRFRVDPRVIVPRSYFGELLEDGLRPWVADPERIERALDLCTGSGCLAVLMAHAFPQARIDAVDNSLAALEVARRNVDDYGLAERVSLVHGDGLAAVRGLRYELIVCNPPYVTAAAMDALPAEYRHEPALALAGGEDGLAFVRPLLASAREHLAPEGVLAVEVGHNRGLVEAAFPALPFVWLHTDGAEDGVFVLTREQLPA